MRTRGEMLGQFVFWVITLALFVWGITVFFSNESAKAENQNTIHEYVTSLNDNTIAVYENVETDIEHDFFTLTSDDEVYYITVDTEGGELTHTEQLVEDTNNTLTRMKEESISYANSWQSSSILFRR